LILARSFRVTGAPPRSPTLALGLTPNKGFRYADNANRSRRST
jgi:hypothetical protein